MLVISIKNRTDLNEFRAHARKLWAENISPEDVTWQTETGNELVFEQADVNKLFEPSNNKSLVVPQRFLSLAGNVVCHSSKDSYALLYRLVYRLQKQKYLLDIKTDIDTAKAFAMERSVRRDCHRMQAFLRFRETGQNDEGVRQFTAWFEPEHFIIEKNSPFFCRRFRDMDWHILSPKGQAHFVQGKLDCSLLPGVKPDLSDNTEQLWQTYYASTFNPARIKVQTMENHMPKKYWHNMPEATLIPDLIKNAHQRTRAMALEPFRTAPKFHERLQVMNSTGNNDDETTISTLDAFKNALEGCKACPLYRGATQTVCGEGNMNADLMIVGEQPGDHEDLSGKPFVGPAGQFLKKYLVQSGINRRNVYMTNAVKHFKYELRGKRRMHKTANINEIEHCRWWLKKEIQLIQPKLILTLGLTAFFSVTGQRVKMHEIRGQTTHFGDLPPILATFHPSYFLRQQNQGQKNLDLAAFEKDLCLVQMQIAALQK